MSEQPQYNSAFVRALSDVLGEILILPDDNISTEMPGGFVMSIIAKSIKPELPGFLAGLDSNDGMRNMFGGIILRLGDAVRADNKTMREEAKIKIRSGQAAEVEKEVGKVVVNGEEYHVKEEKDDKEGDS